MPDDPPTAAAVTAHDVVAALADRRRMTVLAAVALGAATAEQVTARTGIPAKAVAAALHRLQVVRLVTLTAQGLVADRTTLQALAAQGRDDAAGGPLHPFVVGDRLRSLPAQASRRRAVLAHVAEQALEEGVDDDEQQVSARLAAWCEDGEVDHAALRRYLVESGLVHRGAGVYRRGGIPPAPSAGERLVAGSGLT